MNKSRKGLVKPKLAVKQVKAIEIVSIELGCEEEPLIGNGEQLLCMAGYTYSIELAIKEAAAKPSKAFEEMVPEQY